jgi:UDP-N-acetylmuramyl pentapeptide phosphotransferase/UDP-N-acetylglucosamine-1-phosphate transferase
MAMLLSILGLLAGFGLEALLLFFLLKLLQEAGAVRENYLGNAIPVSAGISFPMVTLAVYLLYGIGGRYETGFHVFLLGITAISLLGFIDDILGKRDVTGFKGHFRALFKGRLTTGGLKAMGGGVIGFYLALTNPTVTSSISAGEVILNTLIIALFANMLNLLDLRPGRAIKGFLLILALIAILGLGTTEWILIAPLLGAVLCYFGLDLKARAMMGDAGSNVLGLALGYLCVISLGLTVRIFILAVLLGMHLYTERYSLSRTIEKVRILKVLDDLGRS